MSNIIDTATGLHAEKVVRQPANHLFNDMVELFWIRGTEMMTSVFPRATAEEFLSKHLIPQKEQGLLSDAGIKELGNLGTN